jgi:hypothetical protein
VTFSTIPYAEAQERARQRGGDGTAQLTVDPEDRDLHCEGTVRLFNALED